MACTMVSTSAASNASLRSSMKVAPSDPPSCAVKSTTGTFGNRETGPHPVDQLPLVLARDPPVDQHQIWRGLHRVDAGDRIGRIVRRHDGELLAEPGSRRRRL